MTRVARNIHTPRSYPTGATQEFIRSIEELIQAANGGSEGSDYIYSILNGGSALGIFITHLSALGILQITGGGTGATTAGQARINLGLDIGVDIAAFDANLQAFIDANDLPETAGGLNQTLVADGAGNIEWGAATSGIEVSDVLLTVVDSGGDDLYTITWTVGAGVADGTHNVEIAGFKNGTYAGSVSVAAPSDLTATITVTGAADGSPDFHHVIVLLTNQSTGATLDTQSAFATASVVSSLLLENGDFLLLENGDNLLMES